LLTNQPGLKLGKADHQIIIYKKTMMQTKKTLLSSVLSTLFLLGSINSASAESVAVKGGLIFIADGGLIAKNLPDGQVNQCVADQLSALEGSPVSALLQTATDVTIDDGFAVVTVKTQSDGDGNLLDDPITDAVAIDVSSCLTTVEEVAVQECIATVDLDQGLLIIPCVEIGGKVNNVHMERRGNSSNWEVSFFEGNPVLDNIELDEDEDTDDGDDN
jgi:hypothetical protein